MSGVIIKIIAGFYTVLSNNTQYTCKARGRFRLDQMVPMVGDRVEFDAEEGFIMQIYPRNNQLQRPAVANIDQAIIVLSASEPRPDLLLTDKLIFQAKKSGIAPVIVINKCDILDEALIFEIERDYSHFKLLKVSALTQEGLCELDHQLQHKISCFVGQSAVGKSSILNALIPHLNMPVGNLSKRTGHGKHTTRHIELWPYKTGMILDTPGFSAFEVMEIEPHLLGNFYPEMEKYVHYCKFAECLHNTEPGCAVKKQLETGELSKGRYERYLQLIELLKEKRRIKYD